jgi:hypothetical protein
MTLKNTLAYYSMVILLAVKCLKYRPRKREVEEEKINFVIEKKTHGEPGPVS